MKKKLVSALILMLISVLCASCSSSDEDNTVKIAVMGAHEYISAYETGLTKMLDDLNSEYADSGYRFEYAVYDNNSSYENGAQIADELAKDDSLTAVISFQDMDINSTAAYVFDENNRLFVVPYTLYDSVYENNNYKTVLSLAASGKTIGKTLETAAVRETNAKRWAVCAADDEFSMSEMRGFLQSVKSNEINIVDCSDITTLMIDFDSEIKRWKSLGVEGLVIFPGRAYAHGELFNMIKKIKAEAPEMVCMGDSGFDGGAEILSDPELMKAMEGSVYAVDFLKVNDDKADEAKLEEIRADFADELGIEFNLWYMHVYNMIRMICDTAVKHNTTDGAEIARILHNDGYDGLCQKFLFNEKGAQIFEATQYFVMKDDGTAREVTIDE